MKAKKTICPRCGIREKASPKDGYCRECRAAANREQRLLKHGLTQLVCPLCGSIDVEKGHQYCRKCSKLRHSVRARRMEAKKRGDNFAELMQEASKVNLVELRRTGIIASPSPPPKPVTLEISDFLGRDCEASIFQHM